MLEGRMLVCYNHSCGFDREYTHHEWGIPCTKVLLPFEMVEE